MKLPNELFENKRLKLSKLLIKSYIDKLNELGKLEESKKNLAGSIGGNNVDETISHFVGRFPNGAVRSQYIVINPNGDLNNISTQLSSVFSDKKLSILYLPCGSGAGLLGLLTTFFTLREHDYYPKLPLNIEIIGVDYSEEALEIFSDMISSISNEFLSVGIYITYSTQKWDATKSIETMQLMHQFFNTSADEYFVFFSNFSGAAGVNDDFNNSFRTVLDYVATIGKNSTILWIEPGNFKKAEKLLEKIGKLIDSIKELWEQFISSENDACKIPTKQFKFIHPTSQKELKGNISGLRLIIDGNENDRYK